MYRQHYDFIEKWFHSTTRKPLVLRGARQVGKSTLVRQFAEENQLNLIELNLERHLGLDNLFKTLDTQKILNTILDLTGKRYVKDKTLLFLDEIQATPQALAALRYFYEEQSELAVIAAGSLLEFILSDHSFSMPVGRIQYLKMFPMTLVEFLIAIGQEQSVETIKRVAQTLEVNAVVHEKLMDLLRIYFFVGGMPEAVKRYRDTGDLSQVSDVHASILDTYQDDFSKYGKSHKLALMQKCFSYAARAVGERVKYSQISPDHLSRDVKFALELLEYARVVHKIRHSDCTHLPLGVGQSEKIFKLIFLDIGLMNSRNGLRFRTTTSSMELSDLESGKLAEQFVGQEILNFSDLFFWVRDGKSGNAELDYLIAHNSKIVPIEVKSGKTGSLKSLAVFSELKKPKQQVRFYSGLPRRDGPLLSLPLYAAGFLPLVIDG
jgi:predicted AAA+ superfamily ATPase